MNIVFIGHSHHLTTRSSVFFTDILESLGSVQYRWDDSWMTGTVALDWASLEAFDLIVVWQIAHIADRIPRKLFERTVYVPMHDAVSTLGDKFWRKLRGMRVLSFSMEDHVRALSNRVQSRHVRYFPPLDDTDLATFESGLNLFFWQRRPVPNWQSLSAALPMSQFARVHLHAAPDPGCGEFVRPAANEMLKFNITVSEWFDDKSQYRRVLNNCNVFVAPRLEEGIGMAMLEAMARGMVVVAANAPTMNEYIIDGLNGYLLPSDPVHAVEIVDPIGVSASTRRYMSKGRDLFLEGLPALKNYLQTPSAKAFHALADPLRERLCRHLPGALAREVLKASHARAGSAVERPQVSVVTVVRHGRQALARTMASVLSQSHDSMEYLIVDGGPADGLVELAQTLQARARVVRVDDPSPCGAKNQILDACRGKYVIFMCPGDVFFDEHALAHTMRGAPDNVAFIYGHHIDQPEALRFRFCRAAHVPLTHRRLQAGPGDIAASGLPCVSASMILVEALKQWRGNESPAASGHKFLLDLLARGEPVHHSDTTIAVLGADRADWA